MVNSRDNIIHNSQLSNSKCQITAVRLLIDDEEEQ